MRVVYEAENLIDAHLVKGALEEAGIPAYVRGEFLTGAMGELPVGGLLAVCVPEAAWPRAATFIVDWTDDRRADLGVDDAGEDVIGCLPA